MSTILYIFILFCCTSFGRSEVIENETKPEQKPEWEELTVEEIIEIIKVPFLNITLELFVLFNETIKPISNDIPILLKNITTFEQDVRDKLLEAAAKRTIKAEEMTFFHDENYTNTGNSDLLTGEEIFGPALTKIEAFLFHLQEERPKIEFLYINLRMLNASLQSSRAQSELKLGENEEELPPVNFVEEFYKNKTNLTTILMRNIIHLSDNFKYTFRKLQTLTLLHRHFINDINNLNATLLEKFNWKKRYGFISKSISEMEQFEFFKVFNEAYTTDSLIVVTAASLKWNKAFRSFGKEIDKTIIIAANIAKLNIGGARKKSKESLLAVPQVTPFKKPFTKNVSIIQAISKNIMKGKSTTLSINKYLTGNYDVLNDEDEKDLTKATNRNKDEDPNPEKEAYCKKTENKATKTPEFQFHDYEELMGMKYLPRC